MLTFTNKLDRDHTKMEFVATCYLDHSQAGQYLCIHQMSKR